MDYNEDTQNLFYKIREWVWEYPKWVDKTFDSLSTYYMAVRPFSHIFAITLLFVSLTGFTILNADKAISVNTKELVEGVIAGKQGSPQVVNPLIGTDNPIEADLASLIYEGLVRLDPDGNVLPVLANDWSAADEEGRSYTFHLKRNVYWHDGEKFTADDVIATFNILKSMGSRNNISTSVQDFTMVMNNDYEIVITSQNIKPGFFEDLQWAIMPEHKIKGASPSTFAAHPINKAPIGTGPFKLKRYSADGILLERNNSYHEGKPKLKRIKFVIFEDEQEAINALKTGQIHQLANPPIEVIGQLSDWDNMQLIESNPLYQIYWALYFNLKDNGPSVFKDKAVRQAISYSIDKQKIINQVYLGAAEEASGPMAKNSWAYNPDANKYPLDVEKANALLEETGWIKPEGDTYRQKDGEQLTFKLTHLQVKDKEEIANIIKDNLSQIGIKVELDPQTADDLRNAYVAPRNFESILYAVETPVDPDRINFWHEDAILPPGRNIASYKSDVTRSTFDAEGNAQKTSIINITLQNGYSGKDQDQRNGLLAGSNGEKTAGGLGYYKFQEILMDDAPAAFLFHPKFIYLSRSRVKGINLTNMKSQQDRFLNVKDWYIEVN